MKQHFEQYDELMSLVYSEEADIIAEEENEAQIHASMYEEYMWYKHEDYMLWKRNNNL